MYRSCMLSNSLLLPELVAGLAEIRSHCVSDSYKILYRIPWFSIVITLRHTYSSIVSLIWRNINVTWVIFSIIKPTSWRSCSMVISLPIMDVRQVWSVQRFVSTWNSKNDFDVDFSHTPLTWFFVMKTAQLWFTL